MAFVNLNPTGPVEADLSLSGSIAAACFDASQGTAATTVWARIPGGIALANFLSTSTAAIVRRRRSAWQRELLLGLSREQLVDAGIPLERGRDPRRPSVALPAHVIWGR